MGTTLTDTSCLTNARCYVIAYCQHLVHTYSSRWAMDRYPQELSTTVQNLWDTPKATRKLLTSLTPLVRWFRLKRAAEADCSQGRNRLMGRVYFISALLSITSIANANAANYSIDHLKLYAHSRILDYKEFQCFNKIITKESRWSYTARNGYV